MDSRWLGLQFGSSQPTGPFPGYGELLLRLFRGGVDDPLPGLQVRRAGLAPRSSLVGVTAFEASRLELGPYERCRRGWGLGLRR